MTTNTPSNTKRRPRQFSLRFFLCLLLIPPAGFLALKAFYALYDWHCQTQAGKAEAAFGGSISLPPVTTQTHASISAASGFKRVRAFTRNKVFVGVDNCVRFLETKAGGSLQCVFTHSKDGRMWSSELARAKNNDALYVTNPTTVFLVSNTGQEQRAFDLGSVSPYSLKKRRIIRGSDINGYLGVNEEGSVLYFYMRPRANDGFQPSHVGRANLKTASFDLLETSGISVEAMDTERGIVYWLDDPDLLRIKDFDGQDRSVRLAHEYYFCKLSGDRKRLLLSNATAAPNGSTMAVLHLDDLNEEILPVAGTFASWAGDDQILFVLGDCELWQFNEETNETQMLFQVHHRPSTDAMWGAAPVLSEDKMWVAWKFTGGDGKGALLLGTLLIDLKQHEYRVLTNSWNSMQWLQAPD